MRAALVLLFVAARAAAAPVVVGDGDPRWRLDLPEGWEAEALPATGEGSVLANYARARGGWRLVVARLRANTDRASDSERAFYAGLEEGVRGRTAGYKKLSAQKRSLGAKVKIPVYDLWYRTPGGVRGTRFVIMKNYALMATIDLPRARKVDGSAKKILESLEPAW